MIINRLTIVQLMSALQKARKMSYRLFLYLYWDHLFSDLHENLKFWA